MKDEHNCHTQKNGKPRHQYILANAKKDSENVEVKQLKMGFGRPHYQKKQHYENGQCFPDEW